jgi:hypothetical protein
VSHSTAGYLLYAMVTMKHAFDYQQVSTQQEVMIASWNIVL